VSIAHSLTLLGVVHEQRQWQKARGHRRMDAREVGAVAPAVEAGADLHDSVAALRLALTIVQVVKTVPDMPIGADPSILAVTMADEQMQLTFSIPWEGDDRPERQTAAKRLVVLQNTPADAVHVCQIDVHPDDDVAFVATARDVARLNSGDHVRLLGAFTSSSEEVPSYYITYG